MKIKITLVCLLHTLYVHSQHVFIPDANFRNFLVATYPACFNNQLEMDTTCQEIVNIDYLDVSAKAIVSLEGIQYFDSLIHLECDSNKLTFLPPLSKKLTQLNCGDNKLTKLNVTKNLTLTHLLCHNNLLDSLDIAYNPDLTYLNCSGNKIENLNLENNTKLTELYFAVNKLKSIDVSKNTALTALQFSLNQIQSLDVSKNPLLVSLYCGYNDLDSLDVSHNKYLIALYCEMNGEIKNLDVSNLKSLTHLGCHGNKLSSLSLFNNLELEILYCDQNLITCLPFIPPHLTTLHTDVACLPNKPNSLSSDLLVCNNTDENNCPRYITTGINDSKTDLTDRRLYPNPVEDGRIFIKNATGSKVKISDSTGKLLWQGFMNEEGIDVSPLTSGVYILEISGGGNTRIEKMIVK